MMMTAAGGFPPRPPIPPGPPPSEPPGPGRPFPPEWPGRPPAPAPSHSPATQRGHVWIQPGEWPSRIYERLLDHRIVMLHGFLDGEAATRLSAQLLTLDAESRAPIRLEMQNVDADLGAALAVMDVMDTLRAQVTAQAGGQVSGPALGVLASARHRRAYPSALFALTEPTLSFAGSADSVAAREEQARAMLAELYARLAQVTGREVDAVRADARERRVLTAEQAVGYGLIEERVRTA